MQVGALGVETFLDTLASGLAFAGACAWNPRKAELKAHRRSFAAHFFGPEAAPAQEALDAVEAGLTIAGDALPGEAAPLDALFWEPPFAPGARGTPSTGEAAGGRRFRRLLRGVERAREIAGLAERAQAAIEAAREGATCKQESLALLEWPIRRTTVQADHLLTMHHVRESYADAFLAESSPKAVSQRVLRTAEMLEGLANRVTALDEQLVQLWPLERAGEPPEAARERYRERIELLREKAKELRGARDTYIQTGKLAPPEAVGLDRSTGRLGRAALPGRLPRRHSPAWAIDGGVARVRLETQSRTPGIPWEVLVDFRALAGDEGTFNVRRARLVRFDDATDAVGPVVPSQLTRSGLVFVPEPGEQVYYLYLDPAGEGGDDAPTEQETPSPLRVRQSRDGITVEGPLLSARVEAARGVLDRWRAGGPGGEELLDVDSPTEAGLCQLPETPAGGALRVRVIENGPLLVRIRAESEDGRIRQYDFHPGMPWCEFAVNAPVTLVRNVLNPRPWEAAQALVPSDSTAASFPLDGATAHARWAARARADGLTFAVISPEAPTQHQLTPDRHDVRGEPDLTRLVLWCHPGDHEDAQLAPRLQALTEALEQPPTVLFGPVEERRTREF